MPQPPIDNQRFLRVLGDELRTLRKRRGLIRREVLALLPRHVSLQTIATYELGTRSAPVTRFVELCQVLDEEPAHLFERTWRRLTEDLANKPTWPVDLPAAAQLDDPHLAPLTAWAAVQLRTHTNPPTVRLNRAAVTALAVLCGLNWDEMTHRLPPAKK